MKTLKLLFACGAAALLTLVSCTNEEDESHYAKLATISSESSYFTASSDGGAIAFKAAGGSVVINVDCGTDWTFTNTDPDWLDAVASANAGTLTVTAGQNTEAKENTATLTLQTAESGVKFATVTVSQNAYGAPEITVDTHEWHAPAVGVLTTEIAVTSSDDWEVSSSATWLTAEKSGSGISLTAAENTEADARTAEVTVTCTDGVTSDSETVTVTQDGKAYITLGEETLSFEAAESSATVTVESNFDWTATVSEASEDWITASVSNGSLTVKVAENEASEDREGTVTLTAGDGEQNNAEAQITVSQSAHVQQPLVLNYTTSDAGVSVQLPLYSTDDYVVDCTVDWGDGSDPETVTAGFPNHTYAEAGDYVVSVSGTVNSLNSYKMTGKTTYLTGISQWGETGLKSLERAFYDCSKLVSLPDDPEGAFDEVTTFDYAFQYCSGLTSLPAKLFAGASKATTFQYVFQACSKLESVPAGLFADCTAAEDFYDAFGNCTALTTVEGALFPTENPAVSNVNNMFYYDSKLASLPEGLFAGCSQLTAFKNVFYYCSALTELPAKMLAGCSGITTFENAFQYASGIKSLPEDLFADCVNAENFNYCFQTWSAALESIPTGLFDNCKKITSMYWTFMNATKLTGESPYTEVNGEKVHLYERSADNGFSEITTYGACFMGCTGLTDYASIPSGWLE